MSTPMVAVPASSRAIMRALLFSAAANRQSEIRT